MAACVANRSCAEWGVGVAQSLVILLLSWQPAASIDFSPFTNTSTRPSWGGGGGGGVRSCREQIQPPGCSTQTVRVPCSNDRCSAPCQLCNLLLLIGVISTARGVHSPADATRLHVAWGGEEGGRVSF